MTQIADLKPSISQLSDEEAFALIKQSRFLRRQLPPKKASKATSTTIRKPKRQKSLKQTVSEMTEEQRLKLIAELEGM